MEKRENYIDTIKGIAIISVILIHTVFHSGTSYVPDFMRNIVLLFDVPIFFFMTGCLLSIKPNIDPLKQMAKLIYLFFIVITITLLLSGSSSLEKIVAPLVFVTPQVKAVVGLPVSYWFVPVYIFSLLYSQMILKYSNTIVKNFILIAIPIYYIYSYFTSKIMSLPCLGGWNIQIVLFYIWIILLGQTFYQKEEKKHKLMYLIIGILSLGYYLFNFFTHNLDMQNSKFTLSLPYGICSMFSLSLILLFKNKLTNTFLSNIGSKIIYFYISQCFGLTVLYKLAPYINIHWVPKTIICFSVNLLISLLLGFGLYYLEKYCKTKIKNLKND